MRKNEGEERETHGFWRYTPEFLVVLLLSLYPVTGLESARESGLHRQVRETHSSSATETETLYWVLIHFTQSQISQFYVSVRATSAFNKLLVSHHILEMTAQPYLCPHTHMPVRSPSVCIHPSYKTTSSDRDYSFHQKHLETQGMMPWRC